MLKNLHFLEMWFLAQRLILIVELVWQCPHFVDFEEEFGQIVI